MFSQKNLFKAIHPFEVEASYAEVDSYSPQNTYDSHIHNKCEIYINLSGDVSFFVENNIYPITPSSIVITRPFEYHHCVYHSNKLHKHFWFLFSAVDNEYLFNKFYNRNVGENNLLILEKDKTHELFSVCAKMTNEVMSEFDKYFNFFKIINLINNANVPDRHVASYPDIIVNALAYIDDNLSYRITVSEISKTVNVSINTLERYFMRFLNVSPTTYIKKKEIVKCGKTSVGGI